MGESGGHMSSEISHHKKPNTARSQLQVESGKVHIKGTETTVLVIRGWAVGRERWTRGRVLVKGRKRPLGKRTVFW
jgi:hypothetical protein